MRKSTIIVAPGTADNDAVVRWFETTRSSFDADASNIIEVGLPELPATLRLLSDQGKLDRHSLVAFVCAGDSVEPGAWDRAAQIVNARPEVGLVYGDATESRNGQRLGLHRPAWSPDLLMSQMYFRGVWWARGDLIETVVAATTEADQPTGLHDLAMGVSELADSVASIPAFVATINLADPASSRADDLDVAAVNRHHARVGLPLRAEPHPTVEGVASYRPELPSTPLVSVIVPTGGSLRTVRGAELELVSNAVKSVIDRSTYPNYEVVVVIDSTSPDELGERVGAIDGRVRVVRDARPFNFAATCNFGVEQSSGELVVLLNDDTEVVSTDWIERLVARTADRSVGAVGVRLLYGDGRLQHGGVVARNGSADHLYHGYPGDTVGHHDVLAGACNVLAVTGACLAVRRHLWDAVGGMNEDLPLNYNDVDLCLRLGSQGQRTVFDGTNVLVHLETSSRPFGSENWEHDLLKDAWGSVLWDDPFDNVNLRVVGVTQFPRPVALSLLREDRGLPPLRPILASPGSLPRSVDA